MTLRTDDNGLRFGVMRTRLIATGVCFATATLAGCGLLSSGESGSGAAETTLGPLGSTAFRIIEATTTTLSINPDQAPGGEIIGQAEPTHKIKSGEYPSLLGEIYACAWQDIAAYNELNPDNADDWFFPDKVLKLPVQCLTGAATGDGTETADSTPEEQAESTAPNTTGADGTFIYEVKSGDTMFGIAENFDTSMDTLVKLNGWDSIDHQLNPGDQIKVPGVT
jgi:LysM repeat protein